MGIFREGPTKIVHVCKKKCDRLTFAVRKIILSPRVRVVGIVYFPDENNIRVGHKVGRVAFSRLLLSQSFLECVSFRSLAHELVVFSRLYILRRTIPNS